MTAAVANGTGRADKLAAALTTASPTLAPKQVTRQRRPLKTHKPSGAVSWPLILVEGGEKSGKTWMFAELTASPRVGPSYLIDLTEGSAEEYGAVPGARYEVVELDGTFVDLIDQVENIAEVGAAELAAGRPPVVLGIDTMTVEWRALSEWANLRAASSDSNRKALAADPDAEIVITVDKWNAANKRHRRLMTRLMTFPGIVVMTARGKEVVEIDENGKPTKNRTYKVEGHKDLAYDASVWIRLDRVAPPTIVGCRSVHVGMRPGNDEPRRVPNLQLDRLIFDTLKCGSVPTAARQMTEAVAAVEDRDDMPEEVAAQVAALAAETTPAGAS
jgi:hypothetical protein